MLKVQPVVRSDILTRMQRSSRQICDFVFSTQPDKRVTYLLRIC